MIISVVALCCLLLTAQLSVAGDTLETSGDALAVLMPATAGMATLALKDWEGTGQLVKSTALALSTTLVLKYTINEKRPNGENYSFPSGHSAISFSAAEFIRNRYGWEYGVPAYAAAAFVAYSRVESKEHYFHDVVAGAAIGVASSYLFTTCYKGVNVSTDLSPGYHGVRISSNW